MTIISNSAESLLEPGALGLVADGEGYRSPSINAESRSSVPVIRSPTSTAANEMFGGESSSFRMVEKSNWQTIPFFSHCVHEGVPLHLTL